MSELNPAVKSGGFFLPDSPQSGIDLRISALLFCRMCFSNIKQYTSIG